LVIYEKARNNYYAYSLDITGCIATGKNHKEVKKNIREAINFNLEGLKKDGLPFPDPYAFTKYVEV